MSFEYDYNLLSNNLTADNLNTSIKTVETLIGKVLLANTRAKQQSIVEAIDVTHKDLEALTNSAVLLRRIVKAGIKIDTLNQLHI